MCLARGAGMELGMVGLGRMGGNMAARLHAHGHHVTGFDPSLDAVARAEATGVRAAASLEMLVNALAPPRTMWLMVPSGAALDAAIDTLTRTLSAGDIIVDGGNSWYRDTMVRAARAAASQLHYVDVGTSGGIWGRENGYSLMIGGEREPVERLRPIFEALAPAPGSGWGHVGPTGAGHFVKMVHNAIEYGMMQAYAEGFALLDAKQEFDLDPAQITHIWQSGSVVRSWLLDLIANALSDNADLRGVAPYVEDSGEGRWAVAEAVELAVPAPVITLALQARFRSRTENSYADRLLALLRAQFGGHAIREQ